MKLIHCSYHKCLTTYFQKTFIEYFKQIGKPQNYIHFKSELNNFQTFSKLFQLSSINNHFINPNNFDDVKITRFIRDPRDLVVSGYFYHKQGNESWTRIRNLRNHDLVSVNGHIPQGIKTDESFSEMLMRLPIEEGLIAQIDFREKHFNSMMLWPDNDKRIKLFKYEDFLGHEADIMRTLLQFYNFPGSEIETVLKIADSLSAKNIQGKTQHIRNPVPNQWRTTFTPKVEKYFNERYTKLLQKYNYS